MAEEIIKRIVDVEQTSVGEGVNIFVNDNGSLKQVPASKLGAVRTINGVEPDENGDVALEEPVAIPDTSSPHMQLVTDANGEKKWEERTHYKRDRIIIHLNSVNAEPNPNEGKSGVRETKATANNSEKEKAFDLLAYELNYNFSAYGNIGFMAFYWDGVRYELSLHRPPSYYGNGVKYLPSHLANTGNDEPFCVQMWSGGSYGNIAIFYEDEGEHTLEFELAEPDLKRLDEDFMPTTVPVIQSAAVGQTVVVKAVDENGKPTEWEAADMNGGSNRQGEFILHATLDYDASEGITVDADYSEVFAAILRGDRVELHYTELFTDEDTGQRITFTQHYPLVTNTYVIRDDAEVSIIRFMAVISGGLDTHLQGFDYAENGEFAYTDDTAFTMGRAYFSPGGFFMYAEDNVTMYRVTIGNDGQLKTKVVR